MCFVSILKSDWKFSLKAIAFEGRTNTTNSLFLGFRCRSEYYILHIPVHTASNSLRHYGLHKSIDKFLLLYANFGLDLHVRVTSNNY